MFRALSSTTVRWRPIEGEGLEHLTLRSLNNALGAAIRAESVLIGERGGSAYGVRYRIDCDAGWRVFSFIIETTEGVRLHLLSDGHGNWRGADGTALPQFDGCIDIDLAGTPFTNTLPIRRLGLTRQSGTARLNMLYVPFDSFEPTVDGQLYTCLDDGRLYRYEAADRSFTAELPVDEHGLVIDYPTLFQRLSPETI
ncbi:transcriptional regulator [Sinorhizobium medicae]|uniref:putative glycolipid-binding domain-containing protein n=1 Tax=Sinorhizobium medicae TaxID=110321 RepID=UPI000FDA16BF|nr:putative glycolipid-binding domain-containing protein [Sinorhizobium medicae]MDX0975739.1 transcriptional regulator [Sinorhizobium medicae]MQV84548.1 transcriptional regulator [Sinorhizobium medicae]MQV93453.1 transcriptional regulator [Sinorhizobium medicae]RVP57858.1 transcriptional regulator [Sinorhizobium medicae]RVP76257.1 transcriptional regulator [Sinorhizobium medicae]